MQLTATFWQIGTEKALKKADRLKQIKGAISKLNLRSLALNSDDVIAIASCLKNHEQLSSISFSYNSSMGDKGAIALSEHLPDYLTEVGLVNCGIGDSGGMALLRWVKRAPLIRMICIEQNNFSSEVKSEYREFSRMHPNIAVIF